MRYSRWLKSNADMVIGKAESSDVMRHPGDKNFVLSEYRRLMTDMGVAITGGRVQLCRYSASGLRCSTTFGIRVFLENHFYILCRAGLTRCLRYQPVRNPLPSRKTYNSVKLEAL